MPNKKKQHEKQHVTQKANRKKIRPSRKSRGPKNLPKALQQFEERMDTIYYAKWRGL